MSLGHRRLEILILIFTCALIISVATIGSITFTNLKLIEKQSEKIYEPNKTILYLKLLLADLRNSENCIKSYGLYQKDEYLMEYKKSLEQIDLSFDNLYSFQRNDLSMVALLDSTKSMVEKKILLMNELLSLRNEKQVVEEINRIKNRIDQVTKTHTIVISHKAQPEKTIEKKRNFFSRLFHWKSDPREMRDTLQVYVNKGSLDDVKQVVMKVKNDQNQMFAKMKQRELELAGQDEAIWASLLTTLTVLENRQNDVLKTIAGENIRETEETHKLTKTFGILILVILTILAFFSTYYFYSGKKYREKLSRAVYESKMLAKARESFLANMSHEMRTPLNAISGFTEQLQSSELSDEQRKQLDIINSASKHLLNLVNDVLDLSKIEAEKIRFEKISFNPVEVITESVELLQPKAAYKNLQTSLDIDPDVPLNMVGDPLRLRQVILNLVSNSIKFTQQGRIGIHVFALKDNASFPEKVMLQVMVEDTGIGIAPDMLDKIFENFTQADTTITRKYGGTGLGLSITKKIIELQDGTIRIESKVNQGTRVSFKIPYTISYSPVNKEPVGQENYSLANARGKKVLIADDELFNRILLITILKRWSIEYDEAQNGKEVLEKVNVKDYDLILMDVRMPELSGIDATREIRKMQDQKKAAVPIVALTAVTDEAKKEKCLSAGMNDLITKPYNEKELIKLMERLLSKTTTQ